MEDLLAKVLDADFAMLFTDVVLPGLNGMQLVEAALKAHPQMVVLLTSGYTDERARWEQIQERQLPFLHKPCTQESLLTAVHEALAG